MSDAEMMLEATPSSLFGKSQFLPVSCCNTCTVFWNFTWQPRSLHNVDDSYSPLHVQTLTLPRRVCRHSGQQAFGSVSVSLAQAVFSRSKLEIDNRISRTEYHIRRRQRSQTAAAALTLAVYSRGLRRPIPDKQCSRCLNEGM